MKYNSNHKGMALVFSVSMLMVFSILGVQFIHLANLERGATSNFINFTESNLVSQSSIDFAVAALLTEVQATGFSDTTKLYQYPNTEFTRFVKDIDNPSFKKGTHPLGFSHSGRIAAPTKAANDGTFFTLKIRDSNAYLNINDPNPNFRDIFANLIRNVLTGLIEEQVQSFATQVETIRQLAFSQSRSVTIDEIEKVFPPESKDILFYLTPTSWTDTFLTVTRSPINVNLVPKEILAAVLENISSAQASISRIEAGQVADLLIQSRPFKTWGEFDQALKAMTVIDANQQELIFANAYPGILQSESEQVDIAQKRLIAKNDLVINSTEFSLGSMGLFKIESISRGINLGDITSVSEVLAVVKVFDQVVHRTQKVFQDVRKNQISDAWTGPDAILPTTFDQGNQDKGFVFRQNHDICTFWTGGVSDRYDGAKTPITVSPSSPTATEASFFFKLDYGTDFNNEIVLLQSDTLANGPGFIRTRIALQNGVIKATRTYGAAATATAPRLFPAFIFAEAIPQTDPRASIEAGLRAVYEESIQSLGQQITGTTFTPDFDAIKAISPFSNFTNAIKEAYASGRRLDIAVSSGGGGGDDDGGGGGGSVVVEVSNPPAATVPRFTSFTFDFSTITENYATSSGTQVNPKVKIELDFPNSTFEVDFNPDFNFVFTKTDFQPWQGFFQQQPTISTNAITRSATQPEGASEPKAIVETPPTSPFQFSRFERKFPATGSASFEPGRWYFVSTSWSGMNITNLSVEGKNITGTSVEVIEGRSDPNHLWQFTTPIALQDNHLFNGVIYNTLQGQTQKYINGLYEAKTSFPGGKSFTVSTVYFTAFSAPNQQIIFNLQTPDPNNTLIVESGTVPSTEFQTADLIYKIQLNDTDNSGLETAIIDQVVVRYLVLQKPVFLQFK